MFLVSKSIWNVPCSFRQMKQVAAHPWNWRVQRGLLITWHGLGLIFMYSFRTAIEELPNEFVKTNQTPHITMIFGMLLDLSKRSF